MLSTAPRHLPPPAAAPPAPARGAAHHTALDALRGLAALAVVVFHVFLIVQQSLDPTLATAQGWIQALRLTPAFVFFAGSESVLVFFLLSGYVLYLMLAGRPMTYGTYLRRRLLRLYPPYLVAVLVSITLAAALGGHRLTGFGPWVNTLWQRPPDLGTFLHHVLVIGNPNSEPYNFVLWSLVQEIQISLIFPLLFAAILRFTPRQVLAGSLAVNLGANALSLLLSHRAPHAAYVLQPYLDSLHFLIFFSLGALLARHRAAVAGWYAARSPAQKALMVAAGLCSYTYGHLLTGHLGIASRVGDLLILPGALMLVLFFAQSPRLLRLSRWAPLQFLGRVSYSLYLYHGVILLTFVFGLSHRWPLGPVLLLAVAAMLPLVYVAYAAVERPSTEWSRGARRLHARAPASRT